MISFETIRQTIASGLRDHTERVVVMTNQKADKPDYPYIGYTFTSPLIEEPGQPIFETKVVSSEDEDWDDDIEYTRRTQPEIMISITAYATDVITAMSVTFDAREYFEMAGREVLRNNGIVVVGCEPVQNRDALIEDLHYERRRGFDVNLRTASEMQLIVPTIEDIDLSHTVEG